MCWQLHKNGWHERRDIIGESLHEGTKSKDPTAKKVFNQFPVVQDGKTNWSKFVKTFQNCKEWRTKPVVNEVIRSAWCLDCLWLPFCSCRPIFSSELSPSPESIFRHSLKFSTLKSIFKPCHPGPDPLPQVCQQLVNSVTSDKARMNQTSQDFGWLLPHRDVWVLWIFFLSSGIC